MTRRSPREVERAIDSLAGSGSKDEVFVVSIGGDPDAPTGWMAHEEHERHYGDRPGNGSAVYMHGDGQ